MTSCLELTKNLTYSEFFDSKSDALLKTCFKIWLFSKVLVGKLFLPPLFHELVVVEKTHNCKSWRFPGVNWCRIDFWKQIFHQNLFLYKSISLRNLMRCKRFFFRNLTRSKVSDSKFPELWKIGSRSDAFKFLYSKYDALYKKGFKNRIFSKNLIQNSFSLKTFFFRNNFFKNAQKSQL